MLWHSENVFMVKIYLTSPPMVFIKLNFKAFKDILSAFWWSKLIWLRFRRFSWSPTSRHSRILWKHFGGGNWSWLFLLTFQSSSISRYSWQFWESILTWEGGAGVSAADSVLLIVRLVVRVWLWAPMIHWGKRHWCSAKGGSYFDPVQPPVLSAECTRNCAWGFIVWWVKHIYLQIGFES